jgi:RNA polymerase sigma factor (sigma-70 family)
MQIEPDLAREISLRIKEQEKEHRMFNPSPHDRVLEDIAYLQKEGVYKSWFHEQSFKGVISVITNPPVNITPFEERLLSRARRTVYTNLQMCPPLTPKEIQEVLNILQRKYRVAPKEMEYLMLWYSHGGHHTLAGSPNHKFSRTLKRILINKFPKDPNQVIQRFSFLYILSRYMGKSRKIRKDNKAKIPEKVSKPEVKESPIFNGLAGETFLSTWENVKKALSTSHYLKASREGLAEIMPELSRLSDKYQSLFSCVYLQGMNQQEVAQKIGVNQSAISHRIRRMTGKIAFYLYFKEFSPEYLIENLTKVYPNDALDENSKVLTMAIHLSTGCKQTFTSSLTGYNQSSISQLMSRLYTKVASHPQDLGKFKEMITTLHNDGYLLQDVNFDSKYDWSKFIKKEPIEKGVQQVLQN